MEFAQAGVCSSIVCLRGQKAENDTVRRLCSRKLRNTVIIRRTDRLKRRKLAKINILRQKN